MNEWIEKELLIIAKTLPVLSESYDETVCTGAISRDGNWYRLYPVTFRYLNEDKKYPLWCWIKVKIKKNPKDDRKETYAPDENSIELVGPTLTKENQKIDAVIPFISKSLEELKEKYKADKTSVGMIKIIPEKFYWEAKKKEWSSKQQAILNQLNLFNEKNR